MIEFNQLAMTHAQGSDVMLNRVMTKDNIALAVVLETRDGAWVTPPPAEMGVPAQQSILVATAHIHWDPEFCDVKLIQVNRDCFEKIKLANDTHGDKNLHTLLVKHYND